MRQVFAVVFALFCAALFGCFTSRSEQSTSLCERCGHFEGPTGDDVVEMTVAVVEQPCGDRFLNHELWELADEQGVKLEQKPILEQNGFRVCQIGGLPPAGLQKLLTSRRSCPDPRHIRRHAGGPMPIVLGPVWPKCAFNLMLSENPEEVSFAEGQCLLEIVPTLADEGSIHLRFTPHVRHGQAQRTAQAEEGPDGALAWGMQTKQPEDGYPALSWELTVGPSEYVAIGTRMDRPDTLGQRCFVSAGPRRVQRLLVLRTARAPAGPPLDESMSRSPPLALQAGWVSARGTKE